MINLGAILKSFIYLISSSLLYPVLFLLVILTLVVILYAGSFFAEWVERLRLQKCSPQELPQLLQGGRKTPSVSHRVNKYIDALNTIAKTDTAREAAVENLLQTSTWTLWKGMDKLRILVRVAPSLGLVGTLIPMGTGLAALGQGDMTKLTTDLVIAFTTTVVGLAIGTCSFFFYTVRRRWIEEDVKNMELATELLTAEIMRGKDEIFAAQKN
ncbi:MotA/TolQ/ExbB proton channel family protein [Desulforhopalus singaporensis]|uniref:Biopolymer transport protein ExbB/TolQ n=1 Tax=Desulforhopalus singaporensis TaxID=91360 RepID=A0A1H0SI06_9BACT|nr:MotA/TolQ/ExbB proton channel family protein [Desulforhopalus singaporensis]SDP41384.1 Biopolymer transport protein ExbB/TolQ [Desulforhopalus singaporensis]